MATSNTIIVPMSWRYWLGFSCLTALMGISHELAHHAAGFAICGEWGYKTFNSFVLGDGCKAAHPDSYWLATLVGPVLFNYLPMWIGFWCMLRPDAGWRLFGLSLVFSTIPIMRIVFSLLGANDEPWMIRHLFGSDNQLAFWLMNVAIWALTVPPLILAWLRIGNRWRAGLYALYFIGVPVFVFVFVGIFLENLIIKDRFLADTLWGMPYLVLLAEVLAYIGYYALRRQLWTPRPART